MGFVVRRKRKTPTLQKSSHKEPDVCLSCRDLQITSHFWNILIQFLPEQKSKGCTVSLQGCAKKRYALLIRQTTEGKRMDLQYSDQKIEVSEKILTSLDRFVLDFIRILEQKTPYVIVSGYVAILFGRSRGTEDVDILIPFLEEATFDKLYQALITSGYEFLNAENSDGLYDMLSKKMGIRIAKKDQFIPNIELKFLKDEVDRHVFRDRIAVSMPGASFYISPIDIQIVYKLWLGSDKDIEDAVYLWEIFKNNLDHNRMKSRMKEFGVSGEEYGIVV